MTPQFIFMPFFFFENLMWSIGYFFSKVLFNFVFKLLVKNQNILKLMKKKSLLALIKYFKKNNNQRKFGGSGERRQNDTNRLQNMIENLKMLIAEKPFSKHFSPF